MSETQPKSILSQPGGWSLVKAENFVLDLSFVLLIIFICASTEETFYNPADETKLRISS